MSVLSLLAPRPALPGPDGKLPAGPPRLNRLLLLGLLGAVLGSFASNLDTRLTGFALADLRGGFGVGADDASWVANAYNVGQIAVVPVTPWFASVISQRRSIVIALILLTVACAACPAAPNFTWLVGLRFVQGLGGGALIPLLFSSLLRFTPLHQRPVSIAVYALVTTATPLLAETLAGVLTDLVGWQSVYYAGILVCPVAMMLVLVGLPVEAVKTELMRGADYAGMLLLTLATATLTTALDVGQRLDWFDSTLIDGLFVASVALFAAFVAWELACEKPLIDLRLLRQRNLTCGLLLIFPFSMALLVTSNVVAQYGTQVRGFRELQVGEVLIWAGLLQLGVCALAPFLARRLDSRLVFGFGLFLVAVGCRLGSFIDSDWAIGELLPSSLIVAAGQPLVMVGILLTATSVLRPQDAIGGATLFNVIRTLGGTVGGAILTGVETVRERVHSFMLVQHLVSGSRSAEQAGSLASLAATTRVQATVMASSDSYGLLGLVAIGAMLVLLVLDEVRIFQAPA